MLIVVGCFFLYRIAHALAQVSVHGQLCCQVDDVARTGNAESAPLRIDRQAWKD